MKPITEVFYQQPLIISGPCSAETEEQLIATATALAATQQVNVLRAGIWKPRTKPGMFEGVGTKGLPWLQKAKQITGLHTAVEVATAKQVQDALTFEVDILWVGARTTVNPFSVQEIADALKGVNIPVLIKNPINPDLELWSGAVERIARAGIQHIGLIHRGFSSYGNTDFRNAPMWHLAIDMKMKYPDLPIITDPSHICGNRTGLLDISQRAIDLGFNGLMIESHITPDDAWSDAKQQITPQQLQELLHQIVWRKSNIDNPDYHTALESLRQQINQIDDELLLVLSKRMRVAREIGLYKKNHNITILQPDRWQEIMNTTIAKGNKLGLTEAFIAQYLEAVHLESITQQKSVMDLK